MPTKLAPASNNLICVASRVWAGFLIAPALPAGLLYLIGVLRGYGDAAMVGPMILLPFAYGAAIFLGVPAYIGLRRRRVRDLASFVKVGALIGLFVTLLVFGTEILSNWWQAREHAVAVLKNSVGSIFLGVAYSALTSMIFWVVAVRVRSK